MLSLFGWGLGTGHEHHLKDKRRLQEEGGSQSIRSSTVMTPGTVKRKRGKSTQSISVPAKKNTKTSNDALKGMEVSFQNASTPQSESATADESQPETMEWDEVTSISGLAGDATTEESERLVRLRGAITRQFNLEILLKHNELRLINQEIAKVQISLEQLRRCSVIPYPAMTSKPKDVRNVTNARGGSTPTQPGMIPATQPPPWGVSDGPYSRHYAKWLLADPTFDGTHPEAIRKADNSGKTLSERHTRGGKELSLPMTKPRQRTAMSRYQAVGSVNGEYKEAKGPMILKRALDGKLVKLVCSNCNREDFNSAQGFINHCRIAHSHNLASHEAAARECGQEIDANEVVVTVPESSTATVVPPSAVTVGLVHPLNKPQMPAVPKLSMPRPKKVTQAASTTPEPPQASSITAGSSFKPSAQVPHLSRLFAKLGRAVDLTAAVEDATTKEEFEDPSEAEISPSAHASDEEEDEEDEETTPTAPGMARIPSRVSARGGPSLSSGGNRPKSRKGPERAARRPYASHMSQAKTTQVILPDRKDTHDLSPNTTTTSINNAPSLISDADSSDDDEDYASNVHHESSAEESDEAVPDVDDEDIDLDMDHEHSIRDGYTNDHASSSHADPELRASSKARSHRNTTTTGTARRSDKSRKGHRRRAAR